MVFVRYTAEASSSYMSTYQRDNEGILETLNTHLIRDAKKYGILDDD